MEFSINGNILECVSDSGATYKISKEYCTCVGFGFRRTCKHFKEAWVSGWMRKLTESIKANFSPLSSPYIREKRREALALYLKKNKIKFTDIILDKFEPIITQTTDPKSFLSSVRKELIGNGSQR